MGIIAFTPRRALLFAAFFSVVFAVLLRGPAQAQAVAKSHNDNLIRLAEILGAVHHLRELCGTNEGQLWREQMSSILKAEQPPAQLRQQMVAAFNNSYRGYQRTYAACSTSAKTVTARFFTEGQTITKGMASRIRDQTEVEKPEETTELKPKSTR